MLKLSFYVPVSHLDAVKSAVFEAGAGHQGNYDQCSWQSLGEGQFRPLKGSNPAIGEQDKLETVLEFKVETLVPEDCKEAVTAALKKAHPYEEPAYDFVTISKA